MVREAKAVDKWNKQIIYVVGANGEVIEVKLTDKSPKCRVGVLNETMVMDLWQYAQEGKPKKWYGIIKSSQQAANDPFNAPQTPQVAKTGYPSQRQSQNAAKPDWDAKDLRNAKMNALNNAVQKQVIMADIAKDLTRVDSAEIINQAERFLAWIYEPWSAEIGMDREAEQQVEDNYQGGQETPPDDTDIPF
jgi:hypothetical protein